jgi:hypothetical protein
MNKGYHLTPTIHPEWDLASAWAHNFTVDLEQLHLSRLNSMMRT